MSSSKNYVLIALALTTLGGAGLAWTQYRELVELRAAAMNVDERAEWQKRAWDLEKLNRQLQDDLAALRATPATDDDAAVVAADDRPAGDGRGRGGRGGPGGQGRGPQAQMNALRDLASKPEVQALLRVQQKAAIDARYGALFHNLNLPADQLDKLKTLLADRQTTMQDVMAAARDQGIDPRTDPAGYRKLIADAQNEINNGIKSLIGDGGFTQLQNYEQTQPQRNVVNELQQRLAYTNSPLTPTQADQLVQILANNAPQRANGQANPNPGGQGRFGFGGGGGGPELGGMLAGAFGGPGGFNAIVDARAGPTAPVTPAALSQAQNVLSQTQVAALQDIQQQQQSQQQLQQLLRSSVGNQGGRGGGAGQTQPATGGATGGGARRGKG